VIRVSEKLPAQSPRRVSSIEASAFSESPPASEKSSSGPEMGVCNTACQTRATARAMKSPSAGPGSAAPTPARSPWAWASSRPLSAHRSRLEPGSRGILWTNRVVPAALEAALSASFFQVVEQPGMRSIASAHIATRVTPPSAPHLLNRCLARTPTSWTSGCRPKDRFHAGQMQRGCSGS